MSNWSRVLSSSKTDEKGSRGSSEQPGVEASWDVWQMVLDAGRREVEGLHVAFATCHPLYHEKLGNRPEGRPTPVE